MYNYSTLYDTNEKLQYNKQHTYKFKNQHNYYEI